MRRPHPTQWPAASAVLDTAPGENSRGARGSVAQGTGAPEEGGMGVQGVGDSAANPPPPPGCTSRPRVDAGYCPDPGPLTGNVRGRRCATPRPQGIPYHTIPPPSMALEGEGPERRPQKRLDGRLEEVAKAVGRGYCRLQMPWKPSERQWLGIGWAPWRGGGGVPSPPSNTPLPPAPLYCGSARACAQQHIRQTLVRGHKKTISAILPTKNCGEIAIP